MGSFDAATWQALGLVLTLLGLGLSALVWARRGPAAGLRAVAWSLLPLAAGLTGVLRLGWEITDSVVRWAGRLVFSPLVWAGVAVAVVSVVLFVVSGWLHRRARPAVTPAVTAAGSRALPRTSRKPAASRSGDPGAKAGTAGPAGAATSGDAGDMAEIEEILRKHGIQ